MFAAHSIPHSHQRRNGLVVRALVLSLLLHVGILGSVEWTGWLDRTFPHLLPAWLRLDTENRWIAETPDPITLTPLPKEPEERETEATLTFVDIDPLAITEESPPKTPFISMANTVAANVKVPEKIADKPLIEGVQDKIVRTFETKVASRPEELTVGAKPQDLPPEPLSRTIQEGKPSTAKITTETAPTVAPTPPKTDNPVIEKVEEPAKATPLGDLALAKVIPKAKDSEIRKDYAKVELNPAETPASVPAPARSERPRTLLEARTKKGITKGETMKQEGGIHRLGIVTSLDVAKSPFGNYDAKLIYEIQQRWDDILYQVRFAGERSGKVVVRFRLRPDGNVTDAQVLQSEVGDIMAYYCQSAIEEPAAYSPWPEELKRLVNGEYREITFTFYYN